MHRLALASFTLFFACSHPQPLDADDAGVPLNDSGVEDAGAPEDAGVADSGIADAGAVDSGVQLLITAPAVHATTALPFRADVSGHGAQRLGPVSLVADVGTATLGGKHHVGFAYQSHMFQGLPYTLYDFLSIADDGSELAVTYLYCDGAVLSDVYTESVHDAMVQEAAGGVCDGGAQVSQVSVDLPALSATVPAFDPGIAISGSDLGLRPDGGFVNLEGGQYALVPFDTVDCTTCPGGPWYEIHSVLTAPNETCFAIVYLFPDSPAEAQLAYEICLPSLAQPASETFDVSWSGTLKAKRHHAATPLRPAPPGH